MKFWVYFVFLRYSTDSKLLYSLDSYFTISETVMMEISTKRFSLYSFFSLNTILKLLQMSKTQRIKDKKKTITTFRILSQTSFGYISIKFLTILIVLTAMESPWKDLLINTSHVLRQSILAEILGRSTGNYHGTIY